MNPILYIRKHVLDVSQADFAAIAEVSQGTVSKWENGELEPDRGQLARIRSAVVRRKIRWRDSWIFNAPAVKGAA